MTFVFSTSQVLHARLGAGSSYAAIGEELTKMIVDFGVVYAYNTQEVRATSRLAACIHAPDAAATAAAAAATATIITD